MHNVDPGINSSPLFLVEIQGGSGLEQPPLLSFDDIAGQVLLNRKRFTIERIKFHDELPPGSSASIIGSRIDGDLLPIACAVEIDYPERLRTASHLPMFEFSTLSGARKVEVTGYGDLERINQPSDGHWTSIDSIIYHHLLQGADVPGSAILHGRVVCVSEGKETAHLIDTDREYAEWILKKQISADCRTAVEKRVSWANVLMLIGDYRDARGNGVE